MIAKAFNLPDNFRLREPRTWFRVASPVGISAQLTRRHIYIVPSRFGWVFGLLIIAILIGAINYSLSLGFAMTFLLTGIGLISMLHTWRNLANLNITTRHAASVFAGEPAVFELLATESNNRSRYAIAARFSDLSEQEADLQDIPALSEGIFKLALPSQSRGWLKAPRITFATDFPVSLFHAWAYVELDFKCLIYPSPSQRSQTVPSANEQDKGGNHFSKGDDDFAGHRSYQFGDSPKRVDWKASSKEQGLLTKQFQGEAISTLWLDWNATSAEGHEARISQMTRWVLDAEANRVQYGLRLPQLQINPNNGDAHYHQCLSALALM